MLSCSDSGKERRKPLSWAPRPLILDEVHNNGQRGFFFLPPLVPQPNPEGTNDQSLSPVVRIDKIEVPSGELTTIATFTRNSGPGGEVVQVSDAHFLVNWHSRDFRSDSTAD